MKEQNFQTPHVTTTNHPTGARLIAGAREKSIGKIRFHLTYVFEEEKVETKGSAQVRASKCRVV